MSLPRATRYIGGAGWEDKLRGEGVEEEKVVCQHLMTQNSWREQESFQHRIMQRSMKST